MEKENIIIISQTNEVTMNDDNVLPIVGCIKGIDFSPYFLD